MNKLINQGQGTMHDLLSGSLMFFISIKKKVRWKDLLSDDAVGRKWIPVSCRLIKLNLRPPLNQHLLISICAHHLSNAASGKTAGAQKAPKLTKSLHPIQAPNLQAQLPDLRGYEVSYSCLSHLVITRCHYVSVSVCVEGWKVRAIF